MNLLEASLSLFKHIQPKCLVCSGGWQDVGKPATRQALMDSEGYRHTNFCDDHSYDDFDDHFDHKEFQHCNGFKPYNKYIIKWQDLPQAKAIRFLMSVKKEQDEMKHPIIQYFEGTGRDSSGRTIDDVLDFNNKQLEGIHNYIQYLFPLKVPSTIEPNAPVLTDDVIKEFNDRKDLQASFRSAFEVMMVFYELDNWIDPHHKFKWLTLNNHNFLRLTRILTSTKLLGFPELSNSLYKDLSELYKMYPDIIGERTFAFWTNAVKE